MIFECVDCALGCILAVHAGRDKLEVDVRIGCKIF